MSKKVTYLVSIFIGAPTEQHAKIRDIAAQLSGDDYEFLHLHQMGAFLVLNTDRGATELANSFARATASDDRIFICEIGQDWHSLGLNKAAYWVAESSDHEDASTIRQKRKSIWRRLIASDCLPSHRAQDYPQVE